jgi:hypothetical protein
MSRHISYLMVHKYIETLPRQLHNCLGNSEICFSKKLKHIEKKLQNSLGNCARLPREFAKGRKLGIAQLIAEILSKRQYLAWEDIPGRTRHPQHDV